MALTDKLRAIGDGFRSSRGTTAGLSLDEMAVLAAEPLGSDSGGASIETCTVTVNYTDGNGWGLCLLGCGCTKLENENMVTGYNGAAYGDIYNNYCSIENVVKNTLFIVEFETGGMSKSVIECSNCTLVNDVPYGQTYAVFCIDGNAEISIIAN